MLVVATSTQSSTTQRSVSDTGCSASVLYHVSSPARNAVLSGSSGNLTL